LAGPREAGKVKAFLWRFFIKILVDIFSECGILNGVMRNTLPEMFDELKEQLQEDVMTWHGGLENNHAYPHLEKIICDHGHAPNNWNDMDTLCNIIIERINEYKNFNN
jgi:hypothetical protein